MSNSPHSTPLNEIILTAGFDMRGTNLIEASAGTGKTYCIQTLYLRLVIEHGMPVQSILVVTFTEAATHELRERLRGILEQARLVLNGVARETTPKDAANLSRIRAIAELPLKGALDIGRPADDIRRDRIEQALLDFDEAAIHTIHGFCNTVLGRYAFECGQPFNAELIGKDDAILDEACADWWRRNAYGGGSLVSLAVGRDALRALAAKVLGQPDAQFVPPHVPADSQAALRQALCDLRGACDGAALVAALSAAKSLSLWPSANRESQLQLLARFRDGEAEPTAELLAFIRAMDAAIATVDHPLVHEAWTPFAQVAAAHAGLVMHAAIEVADACRTAKLAKNLLTYDDLILNLRNALLHPQYGPRLRTILRQEYRAALIDEFQDTDPLQYAIFRSLFIESSTHPVFLVGDPKQAIYSFRNGDIYTYFTAREGNPAPRRYTLGTNHRSEKAVIAAVNRVFKDRFAADDGRATIPYDGTLGAEGKAPAESLLLTDDASGSRVPDPAPFRIWYYDTYSTLKKPLGVSNPAYQSIFHDVADEIRRLLDDPATTIGSRRIEPGDIAILVNTHREAEYLHRHLRACGIPAIRQSAGNVFSSDEADDLLLLLQALAEPENRKRLGSALAAGLFPVDDASLHRMMTTGHAWQDGAAVPAAGSVPQTLETVQALFRAASGAWRDGSVIKAAGMILDSYNVPAYLLGLENGERRVTNLSQLLELTHRVCVERRLGPEAAVEWFARQMDHMTREENEAFELRLESDARAVRLLTVFKSKGLEFPIVFIPTLGQRKPLLRGEYLLYHRPSAATGAWELVIDVVKGPAAEAQAQCEQELENRRLFYVAATRAVHRSYVIWGHLRNPAGDSSPLSKVFRTTMSMLKKGESYGFEQERHCCPHLFDPAGPIRVDYRGTPEPFDIRRLAQPDDTEEMAPHDETMNPRGNDTGGATETLASWLPSDGRPLSVDKTRCHASYSGIAPTHRKAAILRDVDADDAALVPHLPAGQLDIFSFVGGSQVGTCWHAIFEEIDFSAWAPGAEPSRRIEALSIIDAILDRYRICGRPGAPDTMTKKSIVHAMVGHVLSATLQDNAQRAFRLHDLAPADRRAELDFDFRLRPWGSSGERSHTGLVRDVLLAHWGHDPQKAAFVRSLAEWNREIPQGFMTGFIDLVFRRDGRYYILDWKSNRRDGTAEAFSQEGLSEEMAAHAYYLQYLIYTVAVHHYLRGRVSGYDYDTHLGGVFYLFLRGIDPAAPGRGIFYDRPSADLIADLSAVLGDFVS